MNRQKWQFMWDRNIKEIHKNEGTTIKIPVKKEATMKKEGLTFIEAVQALVDGKCKGIRHEDMAPKAYYFVMHDLFWLHRTDGSNEGNESPSVGHIVYDCWQLVDPAPTPEEVVNDAILPHVHWILYKGVTPKGIVATIIDALRDKGMLKEGL